MDLTQIEQRWAMLLSADQQEFVQAFLVTRTAKSAAEMAGIKPSTARRYLASPTIQAAIKMAQKTLREDAHVTPEEVIMELRMLRDMSMGRIPVPETKWVDGEPVTRYVKQYNATAANKAVENLGRVVGMFTDKKEITIPATDNQIQKRLEELLGVTLEAEYSEVGHNPPDENAIPEPPQSLSDAFENLATDELTQILAQACDEQGVP